MEQNGRQFNIRYKLKGVYNMGKYISPNIMPVMLKFVVFILLIQHFKRVAY